MGAIHIYTREVANPHDYGGRGGAGRQRAANRRCGGVSPSDAVKRRLEP
jgi:hypothetical protein